MKKYKITYVNNENDINYIKKHKFNLTNNIITGPSNIINKIVEDRPLYTNLLLLNNRFAVNNYKEEKK